MKDEDTTSDQPLHIRLVDTHCHIQSAGQASGEASTRELWSKAPQITGDDMIGAAAQDGVHELICVGCDLEDSELAVNFVKDRAGTWAAIGIHPHEARRYAEQPSLLDRFAKLIARDKVVAVGECGLDYFYEHSPKTDQIEILKFQMELALSNDLPMVFHVREALDDFWPIFDSYSSKAHPIRGVLHSFTDSMANLEQAIARGLFIGVNGIATFSKTDASQAMYQAIPTDRLVLETDAPFLTPAPYRGTINEPKYIRVIAEFIAHLRSESLDMLAISSTNNAHNLFGLETREHKL